MDKQDAALEHRISVANEQYLRTADATNRRIAWLELRALIAQRSPKRVSEMERERGLA